MTASWKKTRLSHRKKEERGGKGDENRQKGGQGQQPTVGSHAQTTVENKRGWEGRKNKTKTGKNGPGGGVKKEREYRFDAVMQRAKPGIFECSNKGRSTGEPSEKRRRY